MPDYTYESRLAAAGFSPVCGVDEAGRGPLVGPVYAAAVILPLDLEIPGLNDSKKVSEKRREALYDEICERALDCAAAFATAEEIEELNILGAAYLAMNRAVAALKTIPAIALIDGNRGEGIEIRHECVVSGDEKCMSIAAASILAKVERDRYMREYAKRYSGYGFERNKGYGTPEHYAALRELGLTPEHRRGFRLI
ncbi:MAG: ribonuclease HII [Oscillospiraceae bacterium]|jgi:ribonuclease HII|nr:ribonuclease HII [Oscillospiraceae bacterium]